jgi:hypothetical protein
MTNYFGYENGKFYVEWESCEYIPLSIRDAWEYRARELFKKNPNLILGLSSGVDSQAILFSFLSQGIPIKTAFFHMKGYNDEELEQLRELEEKMNFKTTFILDCDPFEIKDEVIEESKKLGHTPYDPFMKKHFIKRLPEDHTFIYGYNGPNVYVKNGKRYLIDCPGDLSILRTGAFNFENRIAPVVNWEHDSVIMYSVLTDQYVDRLMTAFDYYSNIDADAGDDRIPWYGYWDTYIKCMVYSNHWGDELIYFSKLSGLEKIDYIMNGPIFNYKDNLVVINQDELLTFFKSKESRKRFYATFRLQ